MREACSIRCIFLLCLSMALAGGCVSAPEEEPWARKHRLDDAVPPDFDEIQVTDPWGNVFYTIRGPGMFPELNDILVYHPMDASGEIHCCQGSAYVVFLRQDEVCAR